VKLGGHKMSNIFITKKNIVDERQLKIKQRNEMLDRIKDKKNKTRTLLEINNILDDLIEIILQKEG